MVFTVCCMNLCWLEYQLIWYFIVSNIFATRYSYKLFARCSLFHLEYQLARNQQSKSSNQSNDWSIQTRGKNHNNNIRNNSIPFVVLSLSHNYFPSHKLQWIYQFQWKKSFRVFVCALCQSACISVLLPHFRWRSLVNHNWNAQHFTRITKMLWNRR